MTFSEKDQPNYKFKWYNKNSRLTLGSGLDDYPRKTN